MLTGGPALPRKREAHDAGLPGQSSPSVLTRASFSHRVQCLLICVLPVKHTDGFVHHRSPAYGAIKGSISVPVAIDP